MKGHRPRKRFGQNFLVEPGVIDRLLAGIDPRPGERIVEIGPGRGALTRPVLDRSGRLDVIELDRDLAAGLADRLGRPSGLVVHQADALRFDYRTLATAGLIRVIGNLPYNISTPLIFHLLDQSDALVDLHFMLQKEVVDRLVAAPGNRRYGRLSVMAGFYCRLEWLFDVGPAAFDPPPTVDSAVVRLVPKCLDDDDRQLLPALDTVVRTSFGQRRKTLRNSLRGLIEPDRMDALGIDPSARPETLDLDQFRALAELLRRDRDEPER
jgi:16S rRNA (adenine1518-N6/adenine1519-N6)-dimethyltransferase